MEDLNGGLLATEFALFVGIVLVFAGSKLGGSGRKLLDMRYLWGGDGLVFYYHGPWRGLLFKFELFKFLLYRKW